MPVRREPLEGGGLKSELIPLTGVSRQFLFLTTKARIGGGVAGGHERSSFRNPGKLDAAQT